MSDLDRPKLRPSTNFVRVPRQAPGDPGEVRLLPPSPKSGLGLELDSAPTALPLSDDEHEQIRRGIQRRQRRQFTLLELLAVSTYLAVGLSAAYWLSKPMLAMFSGLACLFLLGLTNHRTVRSRFVHLALLTVLLVYVAATIASVFGLD